MVQFHRHPDCKCEENPGGCPIHPPGWDRRREPVVRRGAHRVFIGEGDARWSMADPAHPLVVEAHRRAAESQAGLMLASVASDMTYLVHTCPTTKLACEKLAAMRAAVRKLGPVPDENR